MQLGITIPLQKHLKLKPPPYGEPIDLFFCWDLHIIKFHGKNSLIAVNTNNRFAVLLSGMKAADWKVMQVRLEESITSGLASEGYKDEQIKNYFSLAGLPEITKTHGRKSVAGLNKAVDYLYYIPVEANKNEMYQAFHCHEINRELCHAAGFEDYGYPIKFLDADMKRSGLK